MDGSNDAKLVARSLAGEESAFVELIRRHGPAMAALIRRRIADRHHAEDVFQVALLQAWGGLGRLRDASKVKAWLIQIARNRCRDFHKSSQRKEQPTDAGAMVLDVNRYGRAVKEKDEKLTETLSAMEALPPASGRTAKMFYLQELSIAEICGRTGRPAGTIKRQLFDARRSMRRRLGLEKPNEEKHP